MIRPLVCAAAAALALGLSGWPGRADAPECAAAGSTGGPMLGVTGLDPRAFEELTGVDVQLLHIFVPRREGWDPLRGIGPSGRLDAIERALERRPDATVLVSYPPIPAKIEGPPAEALGKCADGEFDHNYAAYAEGLAERGLNRLILRVGWEWDDDFAWGAERDLEQAGLFAACFARVVRSMRDAFPENHLRFDWNSTMAVTPALLAAGYPGDEVVDVVSVEGYDGRGGSDTDERWGAARKAFDLVGGFAKAHGKPLALPEWGIMSHRKNAKWGGGDNPNHIEKVCDYVKAVGSNVLYYAYFDRDNASADHRLESHPRSLEAFRAHCGPQPPAC